MKKGKRCVLFSALLCVRHVCNGGSSVFQKSPGSLSLGVAGPEFIPQALHFSAALCYPGCSLWQHCGEMLACSLW